jgi:hypothetical protein
MPLPPIPRRNMTPLFDTSNPCATWYEKACFFCCSFHFPAEAFSPASSHSPKGPSLQSGPSPRESMVAAHPVSLSCSSPQFDTSGTNIVIVIGISPTLRKGRKNWLIKTWPRVAHISIIPVVAYLLLAGRMVLSLLSRIDHGGQTNAIESVSGAPMPCFDGAW